MAWDTRLANMTLTRHALRRIAEMGLTEAEVLAAARDPSIRYPQEHRFRGTEVRIDQGGRFGVVVHPATSRIVTVIWNTHEYHERGQQP